MGKMVQARGARGGPRTARHHREWAKWSKRVAPVAAPYSAAGKPRVLLYSRGRGRAVGVA